MGFPFFSPPPPPPPPPPPLELYLELARAHAAEIGATLVIGVVLVRLLRWFAVYVGLAGARPVNSVDRKIAEAEARRRKYRTQITTLTFRALKAVAMADGVFHESERLGLEACARTLSVKCPDLDALEPITPQELAASIMGSEPDKCALILMLMCHFALVDGEEHPDEFKLVERFAKAFEVQPQTLADLRARTMRAHESCEAALRNSPRPELARKGSAVLIASPEFYSTLTKLCHR